MAKHIRQKINKEEREIRLKTTFLIWAGLLFLTGSSCSVYMAGKHSGTSIEELQACKTRSCIMTRDGVTVISPLKEENGEQVEVYAVKKKKGSSSRAVMHGVLDVFTLGIWEVAGTPIEASLKKGEAYPVKIYYDKSENIKRIELMQ